MPISQRLSSRVSPEKDCRAHKACPSTPGHHSREREHLQFERIVEDRSEGKITSHHHLWTYVAKHGVPGLKRAYQKEQLDKLSRAYGLRVRAARISSNLHQVWQRCGHQKTDPSLTQSMLMICVQQQGSVVQDMLYLK